jgi:VWFA-related protein
LNRFSRILALGVMAVVGAVPFASAQQKNPDPPKLVDVVEVNVINVDVVVTDRKGNPVTGLKRDDFEVLENGVRKPITNFYEVRGGSAAIAGDEAPAPAPVAAAPAAKPAEDAMTENTRRRVIIYIDNLSLAVFNRNRVFTQMKQFVRDVMRPGDEAMIATFNRSMKIRVPFTRDVDTIISTLDTIAGESALGTTSYSERKSVESRIRDARNYDEASAAARTYANSAHHDLRQSVTSINALMSTLAGVEGKKVLVLTSEGFPIQPGREMFQFIDEIAREKNWSYGSSILEGMSFNSQSLVESVAKTANANGITVYTIHAAGLQGGQEMSAENSRMTPASVSQAALSNTTESMRLVADLTGGTAATQTNNFTEAFRRIKADLESYYSLGYRAGTERVDRQRYLEVRMKNKAYIARSRQTFVEKSTFAEMSDRVVANLLYRTKANDLGIVVRMGTPRPADEGLLTVPVEVHIPMDSLTMLPQGDSEYVGGFEVYVVVADKQNDMSDVARKSHQLRISKDEYTRSRGKFYTYSLDLLMERGLNRVSVGVVDQITNTSGFAREQIIATAN